MNIMSYAALHLLQCSHSPLSPALPSCSPGTESVAVNNNDTNTSEVLQPKDSNFNVEKPKNVHSFEVCLPMLAQAQSLFSSVACGVPGRKPD